MTLAGQRCRRQMRRRQAPLIFDVDRAASALRGGNKVAVSRANGDSHDESDRVSAPLCGAVVVLWTILALILVFQCTGDPLVPDDPIAPPSPPMMGNGTLEVCDSSVECPTDVGDTIIYDCNTTGTCNGPVCEYAFSADQCTDEPLGHTLDCVNASGGERCACASCVCVVITNTSLVRRDCVPITPEPTPAPTSSPTLEPTPAPTLEPTPAPTASCCPQDPYVYFGSPYASASPTACGTRDYNCDGQNDTFACCFNVDPIQLDGERALYNASECAVASGDVPLAVPPDPVCGACADNLTVVPGWACNQPILRRRKRFVLPCPEACDGQVEASQADPPDIGECALFTDHCVPPHGGDGEQCCLVVSQ